MTGNGTTKILNGNTARSVTLMLMAVLQAVLVFFIVQYLRLPQQNTIKIDQVTQEVSDVKERVAALEESNKLTLEMMKEIREQLKEIQSDIKYLMRQSNVR